MNETNVPVPVRYRVDRLRTFVLLVSLRVKRFRSVAPLSTSSSYRSTYAICTNGEEDTTMISSYLASPFDKVNRTRKQNTENNQSFLRYHCCDNNGRRRAGARVHRLSIILRARSQYSISGCVCVMQKQKRGENSSSSSSSFVRRRATGKSMYVRAPFVKDNRGREEGEEEKKNPREREGEVRAAG